MPQRLFPFENQVLLRVAVDGALVLTPAFDISAKAGA